MAEDVERFGKRAWRAWTDDERESWQWTHSGEAEFVAGYQRGYAAATARAERAEAETRRLRRALGVAVASAHELEVHYRGPGGADDWRDCGLAPCRRARAALADTPKKGREKV